jgi:flagellar assembly factor FliW
MVTSTTRFGEVRYEEGDRVTLPAGMLGFPKWREYIVVQHGQGSPFRWLQSLQEPSLAFLVANPQDLVADYNPTLSDDDVGSIELTAEDPVLVYVVVTIPPGNPKAMTANLAGPIIINPKNRLGRQVIVEESRYGTKHRVLDELKSLSERAVA